MGRQLRQGADKAPLLVVAVVIVDMQNEVRLSADQQDNPIPLDWMENLWPERWMVNGKEMRFCRGASAGTKN